MLPATRRVSNAVASCSSTTSKSFITTAAVTKSSTRIASSRSRSWPDSGSQPPRIQDKTRETNGFGDFVKRLSERNEASEDDTGQRRSWTERKTGAGAKNSPLQLTVRGLKPYEVVERVNVLLNEAKLDAAIGMVENLPADTVNVVVWNCLISAAIKAERYKLAFELYYDMKRRHITPNTRTFTTLFVGLSRIPVESWPTYKNILTRVLTAYTQLQTHFAKLQTTNPTSPDITPWPINGFLSLLAKVGMWNKMWDVFFEMEGRLKPDEVTYTIMLNALRERKTLEEAPSEAKEGSTEPRTEELVDMQSWEEQFNPSLPDEIQDSFASIDAQLNDSTSKSVHYRNASDARLLWDHLTQAHRASPADLPITSHHLSPLLQILAFGKPSDQELGYQIVRSYLGLETPGISIGKPRGGSKGKKPEPGVQSNIPAISAPTQPLIQLNGYLFNSLLTLCIQSAQNELAINFFQTIASDPKQKLILDSGHMLSVMRAFAMRRPPKTKGTYKGDARETIGVLEWMMNENRDRQKSASRNWGDAEQAPSEKQSKVGNLRARMEHFTYALMAAWRNADMNAALKVFEIMTGLERASFMASPPNASSAWDAAEVAPAPALATPRRSWKERMTSSTSETPTIQAKTKGYPGVEWDTTCMTLLVKTASATNRAGDMKIALQILQFFKPRTFFHISKETSDEILVAQRELVTRTVRVVDTLLATANGRGGSRMEVETLMALKRDMEAVLARVRKVQAWREEDSIRQLKEKSTGPEESAPKASIQGLDEEADELLVTLNGKRRSDWADDL